MGIIEQLSSNQGERSGSSNKKVAAQCIEDPKLLREIAGNLSSKDDDLAADCAEVMTTVAQSNPGLVAAYAKTIAPLILHKNTRARYEAAHAISLIADKAPDVVEGLLSELQKAIKTDKSVIVRDYSVDAVANFSSVGAPQAMMAYPILKEALTVFEGKQAHHAMAGLAHVARLFPQHAKEIREIVLPFASDKRAVVVKAAKSLLKQLEKL